METSTLALLGGPKAVTIASGDAFTWPIVTAEDEEAIIQVVRRGAMSGTDVTKKFEQEWAAWNGCSYAVAYCNGTSSLHAAMWACGVGAGDEIICPSMTYWASCTSALSLGAAVNFADIDPQTLCIDPDDIEHRIGPRTKLIVVVHYAGHPCDMDRIMAIARRHGVKVLEDVSHAHGSLYKGRKCGTLGDIAGMSMMAGKGFAIGEGGMMTTDDRLLYERCLAFGHYERTGVATRWNAAESNITDPGLLPYAGIAMGGFKHRINQTCSAMGRVQLKSVDARSAAIRAAMDRFWAALDGVPGLRPHRIATPDSHMGPWYFPQGHYRSEELHGLPIERFVAAVAAEGVSGVAIGANHPLHLHNLFHTADLFAMGRPTMLSFGQRDVRQGPGSLPVAETVKQRTLSVPWFKHDRPELIGQVAAAFRKVLENHQALLAQPVR